MTLTRMVSGGQTGVDRAALDAAMAAGVAVGGWCPQGRRAEDGPIPRRYPLRELAGGYLQRTRQNVIDSDGTLILYFDRLSGGTEQTLVFCLQRHRPYVLIDGQDLGLPQAVAKVRRFLERESIAVLNVAGPRHSTAPQAYAYAHALLERLLSPGR